MKQTKKNTNLTAYRGRQPTYPNAADKNYINRKLLDIATAIVSGMGFITAMVFLIALT